MSTQINALRGIANVTETAKVLYQTGGLRALAMLPFCHVGFVAKENKRYLHLPQFEQVVLSRKRLPKGAIVTREKKHGELLHPFLEKNVAGDWVAVLHDDNPAMARGLWPIRLIAIPHSSHLTHNEALKIAKKLFIGD